MSDDEEPLYSPRVGQALQYAADAHRCQTRKGKSEPYISHILAVAALVAHYGGDEDQIIAGVLHDVVEGHGGEPRAVEIGEIFGTRVEAIVRDCSDSVASDPAQKTPWRERKEAYLATIAGEDVHGGRLVEACDKLANLRDIVEDLDDVGGPEALDRFNGGRDGTRWYYSELGQVLMPQIGNERLREAYARELADMNRLCEVDSGT